RSSSPTAPARSSRCCSPTRCSPGSRRSPTARSSSSTRRPTPRRRRRRTRARSASRTSSRTTCRCSTRPPARPPEPEERTTTTTQREVTAPAVVAVRPVAAARRRPASVRTLVALLLVVVVALLGVASVTFGVLDVGWDDLVAGITGHQDTTAQAAVVKRMPRTVFAMVIGAALGISGAVMQGVTRNPLADPEILGVNAGASLAVVVGIVFLGLSTAVGYIWVAMVGAAVAAVFVYVVGSLGRGGATPLKLALAGAATSVALGSLLSAMLLRRARGDAAQAGARGRRDLGGAGLAGERDPAAARAGHGAVPVLADRRRRGRHLGHDRARAAVPRGGAADLVGLGARAQLARAR